jgi:hypothetical protein
VADGGDQQITLPPHHHFFGMAEEMVIFYSFIGLGGTRIPKEL